MSTANTTSRAGRIVRDRLLGVLPNRHILATMGRSPRKDLLAGLTVAIIALPLALSGYRLVHAPEKDAVQ